MRYGYYLEGAVYVTLFIGFAFANLSLSDLEGRSIIVVDMPKFDVDKVPEPGLSQNMLYLLERATER